MIQSERILSRLSLPPFRPLLFFRGGWAQTIASVYWPQRGRLEADREHHLLLPDGDRLSVLENLPSGDPDHAVVLVHGLTGSCDSSYMSRLARKFAARGAVVFRMNLRGCGPGFGFAKEPYHSGRSEDARAVVRFVSELYPRLGILLTGFSLGANIVLKMAGEDAASPTGNLRSVVAISPPADLSASASHLGHERNRFFDQFFVRELKRDIGKLHAHFPELPLFHLPEKLSLKGFDDAYTAPRGGFKSAEDYYARSSSLPLIPRISVPTLIVSSMDDPVVDSRCFAGVAAPDQVDILLTEKGGHVGFLGWTGKDFRWMDRVILRWWESTVA